MTTLERLLDTTRRLPADSQREVLDFAQYLATKLEREIAGERDAWNHLSLESAVRGLEEEPDLYSSSSTKPT